MKRATIAATTTTSAATVNINSTKQDIGSTAVGATLLDRKIEDATEGLRPEFSNLLHGVTYTDALIIVDYIQAVKVETNLSDNYRKDLIKLLCIFSKYYSNTNQTNNKNNREKKALRNITRCDVTSFLYSSRIHSLPAPKKPNNDMYLYGCTRFTTGILSSFSLYLFS